MSIRYFIMDNFLGISYSKQQQILECLTDFLKENGRKKLSREFNDILSKYLDKIKSLLEFKEKYKEFNSDKRRVTRMIFLEEFKETVKNHDKHYSEKQHFCYTSEWYDYGECKRYFDPSPVSSDYVQEFLEEYSNLDIEKKRDFIEDMILCYYRINYLSLPSADNMLKEYRPIIQSIIGDELMEYYDCLYPEEQMELILKIVFEFEWFKHDDDYYNRKLEDSKENPKLIRILKKETIDCCKEEFS